MKNILFLASLMVLNSAFASADPELITGTWQEIDRKGETMIYQFNSDYTMYEETTRNIYKEEGSFPGHTYPTVCRYRRIGAVTNFGLPSADVIARHEKTFRRIPKLEIQYTISRVELVNSASNSSTCAEFIKQKNAMLKNRKDVWYVPFRDLADDLNFQTWDHQVFRKIN